MIAVRVHLFPSRTQKLSSFAPTILGGRLPGKIGNANTQPRLKSRGFFAPMTVHRTVTDGATILGLPRKTGNANTSLDRKIGAFCYTYYNVGATLAVALELMGLSGGKWCADPSMPEPSRAPAPACAWICGSEKQFRKSSKTFNLMLDK